MKKIFPLSLNFKYSLTISTIAVGILGLSALNVKAEDKKTVDILPAVSAANNTNNDIPEETTHSIIRLTPDKSELIRLEQPAGSIIIGNPAHINIIADSSTTLVIVPRNPGATHFTVLGKTGELIMQRHVIVASPKEDYIRIRKTCSGNDEDCQKTSVFYCPDMCHEIELSQDDGNKGSGKSSGASASQGKNGNDAVPQAPPEPVEPPP